MLRRIPFVVRELTCDDIDLFRELLAVMGEAFGDLDTYARAQPGTPYLRKLLGGDQFIALAALEAARGAYVIFVQADPPDEPAVALYTKLGAREEVLHFDIAVD